MSSDTKVAKQKTTSKPGFRVSRTTYPTIAAVVLLVILLVGGQLIYGKIFAWNTFSSLLHNNAYLVILAVGMTFAILTGGIDLSVGAVLAFASVSGVLLLQAGVPWPLAAVSIVLIGTLFGLLSGMLITYFNVQPFIATLSSMFLARGLASILSTEPVRVPKESPMLDLASKIMLIDGPKKNDLTISINILIALAVVIIAFFLLHNTRFGRTVYGLGGSEQSTELMGLPANKTKILVYLVSGTCAGLAGLVYTTTVGNAQNITGVGWELDAIAAVIIGGTLLTGGAGYVLGSVAGVFVLGVLKLLITRDGNVPAAATTIITGAILLVFVLLQRAISLTGGERGSEAAASEIEKEQEKAPALS
ncbi:hypothetical protein U6G28_03010 [Actinomycetaceae bacterium MB13-C1-2]|nr:hypothetical protein U6G28_03010 [Actinomycetaceae bacterium MB13-C1-2]